MYAKCDSVSGCFLLPQRVTRYIFTRLEEEGTKATVKTKQHPRLVL